MHDQFREEETAEIRELQRELETTAKACRIVNFKLRKAERRCDQLEAEKVQAEDKSRQLEARFRTSDDRRLLELEEELRMAKVAFIHCIAFVIVTKLTTTTAAANFRRNHSCSTDNNKSARSNLARGPRRGAVAHVRPVGPCGQLFYRFLSSSWLIVLLL